MRYWLTLCLFLWSAAAAARSAHYQLQAAFDLDRGTFGGTLVYTPARDAPPQVEFYLKHGQTIHSVGGADIVGSRPSPGSEQVQIVTLQTRRSHGIPTPIHIRFSGSSGASRSLIQSGREDLWFPTTTNSMGPFTAEATIAGIPRNLHLVSNGIVSEKRGAVRIRLVRPDFALVLIGGPTLSARKVGDVEFVAGNHALPDNRVFAKHASEALSFVEGLFGRLVRPIRIVSLDHQRPGGYYHNGTMVVRQKRTPPVPEMYESEAAYLMGHEFAHHFWPEYVLATGDKWLAESIASFVGLRFVEQRFGLKEREAHLDLYRKYMPPTAGAIAIRAGDHEATNEAIYFKGPLALFDLEDKIGREKLDDLLRSILVNPEPRSTALFLRRLATASGTDVAAQFEARLYAEQ